MDDAGYVDINERFFCFWTTDKQEWGLIDSSMSMIVQDGYENLERGEPFPVISLSKGEDLALLNKRITGMKKLLKLFGTYYEHNG